MTASEGASALSSPHVRSLVIDGKTVHLLGTAHVSRASPVIRMSLLKLLPKRLM